MMSYLIALLLSFVEGVTEFLPISSTGHLIIVSSLLGLNNEGFVQDFNIIIQAGAILSVLVLYWRRFLGRGEGTGLNVGAGATVSGSTATSDVVDRAALTQFYAKIFVAFLPAAVIGLLVKKKIDALLGSVDVVAWALVIGGVVLIFFDRWLAKKSSHSRTVVDVGAVQPRFKTIEDLNYFDCLKLGLLQCVAFVPGVSRSGATIVGGLILGLDKKSAAEFSFFLAVPTLMGAAVLKGASAVTRIQPDQIGILLFGILMSFIFATLAIKLFIQFLNRTGLSAFGYYRIVVGAAILMWQMQ